MIIIILFLKCFYIRHVTINYLLEDNDVLTIKRTNKKKYTCKIINAATYKTMDFLRRINHKQKSLLYFLGYKNPLNESRYIILLFL